MKMKNTTLKLFGFTLLLIAISCEHNDYLILGDVTVCWDTNLNGKADPDEDVNQDGNYNALDCQGLNGLEGTNGLSCWDVNRNRVAEESEDINQDGHYDTLDCQAIVNANVTRVEYTLDNYSGSEWEFILQQEVLPITDYAYLTYIRRFSNVIYDVPGHLTINDFNDVYCRRLFRVNDIDDVELGIRFYNVMDDTKFNVPEGEYDLLILFAIEVTNTLSNKDPQEELFTKLKSAGVDVSDYNQVAQYFGYID